MTFSFAQGVSSDSTTISTDHLNPENPRHFTFESWIRESRLFVLDRKHNEGGRFYDRGVFHRFDKKSYREYVLDRFLYAYPFNERRSWHRSRSGFRLWGGSVLRYQFGYQSEIKHRWREGKNGYSLRATIQDDLHADRALLQIGYERKLTEHHAVGLQHTLTEFKPDLDVSLYYEYQNEWLQHARLTAHLLDFYNGFIYQTLGVSPAYLHVLREYQTAPILYEAAFETDPRLPYHVQITAAYQPTSTALYYDQTDRRFQFRERRRLGYLAALADYDFGPLTAGLYHQRQYSRVSREGRGRRVSSDYAARQRFSAYGALASFRRGRWVLRARYQREYYTDLQQGENFDLSVINAPLDYRESIDKLILNAGYRPRTTGLTADIYYLLSRRDIEPGNVRIGGPNGTLRPSHELLADWFIPISFTHNPGNYRVALQVGYKAEWGRFEMGVEVVSDADINVYARDPRYFDGGFGRMVVNF